MNGFHFYTAKSKSGGKLCKQCVSCTLLFAKKSVNGINCVISQMLRTVFLLFDCYGIIGLYAILII